MLGPILADAPWVNADQRAQALEFAHDIQGDSFQVGGIYWYPERFECCRRATYFAPDRPKPALAPASAPALDASFDQAARERGYVVPKCPACEPWEYLADRSEADRVRLVKALAKTDALHTMLVTLDEAQHEGRTAVSRMRNPADVLLIDQLERAKSICMMVRGHYACVASTPVAGAWARVSTRTMDIEIDKFDRSLTAARPELAFDAQTLAPAYEAGWTHLGPVVLLHARFIRRQRPLTYANASVTVVINQLRSVWVESGYEEIADANLGALDAMAAG